MCAHQRAFARRVRIAFLIGLLMMDAMRGHPEDRAALERQRAAEREEVLDPLVASCSRGASAGGGSAMPMPSMPAGVVEDERGQHRAEVDEEEGGHGADVKRRSSRWR